MLNLIDSKKKMVLQDALMNEMTTSHTIEASFGQAHFFEYLFKNPYNHDATFEINIPDDELR